jgi:hypothetical protein
MEMEARQNSINDGSRFRSKSYQVRLIVKARPVGYYVSYFEVLCKKNEQNKRKYLVLKFLKTKNRFS